MHLYSGVNFNRSKVIEVGHICPDEILDLCFEAEIKKPVFDDEFDDLSKRFGDSINHNASNDYPGLNDAKIFN